MVGGIKVTVLMWKEDGVGGGGVDMRGEGGGYCFYTPIDSL